MIPASPYTTSEMVALFQRNLIYGQQDFHSTTTLPDTTIDKFIVWVSAAINQKFSEAGYILPFEALTGEVWPDHQSQWLELVTCLGVCSFISPALLPAPGVGPGSTASSGNVFKNLYDEHRNAIYDPRTKATQLRFRAKYYNDSAAERVLLQPRGPTNNFMAGYLDPSSQMLLSDYTDLMDRVRATVAPDSTQVKWDYLYSWLGLGYGKV